MIFYLYFFPKFITIFSFSRFFKFTFFFFLFFIFTVFTKFTILFKYISFRFFSFFFLNHFHEFAIFWDTLYVCVDLQFSSSLCKFNAFFKVQMEEGYALLNFPSDCHLVVFLSIFISRPCPLPCYWGTPNTRFLFSLWNFCKCWNSTPPSPSLRHPFLLSSWLSWVSHHYSNVTRNLNYFHNIFFFNIFFFEY